VTKGEVRLLALIEIPNIQTSTRLIKHQDSGNVNTRLPVINIIRSDDKIHEIYTQKRYCFLSRLPVQFPKESMTAVSTVGVAACIIDWGSLAPFHVEIIHSAISVALWKEDIGKSENRNTGHANKKGQLLSWPGLSKVRNQI